MEPTKSEAAERKHEIDDAALSIRAHQPPSQAAWEEHRDFIIAAYQTKPARQVVKELRERGVFATSV
jgi:hypothetical protein